MIVEQSRKQQTKETHYAALALCGGLGTMCRRDKKELPGSAAPLTHRTSNQPSAARLAVRPLRLPMQLLRMPSQH